MSPPLRNAPPCWAPDQRVPSVNSSISPGKRPKKKRARPPVFWMPSLTPARVRRWMSLDVRLGCPQLRGAAKGIMPCRESVHGHKGNLGGPRLDDLVFPCSGKTTKEDTISYPDWHSKIEDTLEQGHNAAKVKEEMFTSCEGMARDNAKMIDENGDLHFTHILDGLDSLYGVSMTFQSLNAALCGLQQRQMEPARAYYNRMAQITVILRECHGNRYRPGELARMSKDCFYMGLLPEKLPHGGTFEGPASYHPLDLLRAL